MKKLTRRGFTAAGIIAALSSSLTKLVGCDFDLAGCSKTDIFPSDNEVVDVYGPPNVDPSDWDDPDTWDDYDPDDNELIDVYGPPAGEEDDDYDEEDNVAITLYGPPATDEGD